MEQLDRSQVLVFTDGASKGNPGRGGWGSLIVKPDGSVEEKGGAQSKATNNQMELMAAIVGLESLVPCSWPVLTLTDSSYVIKGIESWIKTWVRNDWRTKTGQAVANQELWQRLLRVAEQLSVEWRHVKGHAGIAGNERVDTIASSLAMGETCDLFHGNLSDYPIDPYCLAALERPKNPGASRVERKAPGKRKRPLVYLSYIDGKLLEHQTWPECEARVKGRASAKFKKAFCDADVLAIKKQWGLL